MYRVTDSSNGQEGIVLLNLSNHAVTCCTPRDATSENPTIVAYLSLIVNLAVLNTLFQHVPLSLSFGVAGIMEKARSSTPVQEDLVAEL